MKPRLVIVTLVAAATMLITGTSTAVAAGEVDAAAVALRGGDSVYSDPAAENALSAGEVSTLSAQIAATSLPIFMAVLPASAGSAEEVLASLKDTVGLGGIYAVVVGGQFRAGATSGSAADLATTAFRSQRDNGVFAVLTEFVSLANVQFNGSADTSSSSGSGAVGVIFLLLLIGAVVVLVVVVIRKRKQQVLQLAQVRKTIDEDVTEYGERLARFDTSDPDFDEETRADLQRALDDYELAKTAAGSMRSSADASKVTAPLEDGRFAVACVQARLDQQPLPERRAPCFVDPRHGPSIADVTWEAPGLTSREVPMCAACRTDVETGGNPMAREVDGAGGRQPYWQAGSQYGAYAQGYYSPFGAVMTTVMMGTMLSSMWGMPGITSGGGGTESAGFGGWGGGGGGGDFGGGGGGDFGGGDF